MFKTLLGTYWTQKSNLFVGARILKWRSFNFCTTKCEMLQNKTALLDYWYMSNIYQYIYISVLKFVKFSVRDAQHLSALHRLMISSKGFFNRDTTKVQRQGQQNTPYFWPLFRHFSSVSFAISWWKDIRANNESKLLKFTIQIRSQWPSTLRALRPIYGRNSHPSRSTIERLVEKFESIATVQNVPVPVKQRSARSAFQLILVYILTKSKWCKNWSRLTTRSVVCSWIGLINNLKMIWIFIEKSDCTRTPWVIIATQKNYGLWTAGGVIGPYFFRDDQDRHVTMNGNRYRKSKSKIGFGVWTSASVHVVTMQKKSSFTHNGIERTFTGIKNFIDVQNRFCFV